jgi:hypothetical protein
MRPSRQSSGVPDRYTDRWSRAPERAVAAHAVARIWIAQSISAARSKLVKTREFYSNTAGGNSARKLIAHTNQVEVEREMTTGA